MMIVVMVMYVGNSAGSGDVDGAVGDGGDGSMDDSDGVVRMEMEG